MTYTLTRWLIPERGGQLGWGVLVSMSAHLLLVALLMFWPGWGFNKRQMFVPVYNVNLVGGPPKLAPPAPPAAKPASKPKAKPVAKPKPAPKPKPKKEAIATKKEAVKPKRLERKKPKPQVNQSKALEKRIKRLQKKVAEERAMQSAISRLESRAKARGAVGGVSGRSGGGTQASTAVQAYYGMLQAHIHRYWRLPETIRNSKGLLAIVAFRVRRDGHLERFWLEKSSGNRRFDDSALRAMKRAAPLPSFPRGIRERTLDLGFNFRPEDING